MDPCTSHADAVPPETMPGDKVSSIFPSHVKMELNLESSSLMKVNEDSTSGFHALKALSKFFAAASNTTTRSSRRCAVEESSMMHVLKAFS
jgi:hypothetical protein